MKQVMDTDIAESTGWQAQLDLQFCRRDQKTVLSQRQQRGPLSVQRAFYPEGDVCHLYLLHPPGGVVGGDTLTINADVQKQAHTLLTTPGATKFYRSQGDTAHQQQNLHVDELGILEWLPQENIYFPGAQVQMHTRIDLAANTHFLGWETHCLGLPTNQEHFSSGRLDLDFSLYKEGRPVVMECIQIMADRLAAPAGLRGNPVMANLIACPTDEQLLDAVRDTLPDNHSPLVAATMLEDCLLIRYLGHSTAECRKLFTSIWSVLRPAILKKTACPPRIWAT